MATHISTRYFIILVETKKEAKILLEQITTFLTRKLNLKLNQKSKFFPSTAGIDFCGYKIFETHILLRKRFKNKFKKNIKIWNKLYDENKLNYKKMNMSLNSFKAHASHSNSYQYLQKMHTEIDNIIKNKK